MAIAQEAIATASPWGFVRHFLLLRWSAERGGDTNSHRLRAFIAGTDKPDQTKHALLRSSCVFTCAGCEDLTWTWDRVQIVWRGPSLHRSYICLDCRDSDDWVYCQHCGDYQRDEDTTPISGYGPVCDIHLDRYTWCEECQEYYTQTCQRHRSEGGCDCEAPYQAFEFPADGAGSIKNDTRLSVELAAGLVSDAGLRVMRDLLRYDTDYENGSNYTTSREVVVVFDEIAQDPRWQTKQGNFTKRISRAVYRKLKVKLPEGTISRIGNVASEHSTKEARYEIEFTRDLNRSAADFYYDGSCWWISHYMSRCILKAAGGMGLRSFDTYGDVNGRAWVQPLNVEMKPTHDAMNAHAYLVFNCYGVMEGFNATRIIAHLTDKTYTKVSMSYRGMYVNGGGEYTPARLVADQATCDKTEMVEYEWQGH